MILEIYEQSEEKSVKMVAKILEDMKVVPKSEKQPVPSESKDFESLPTI